MKSPALLLALFTAMPVGAEPGGTRIVLSVGAWVRLDFPTVVAAGVCDDPTIVRTEVRHGALGVLGLKTGHTQCGYWAPPRARPHWVFDITVVP